MNSKKTTSFNSSGTDFSSIISSFDWHSAGNFIEILTKMQLGQGCVVISEDKKQALNFQRGVKCSISLIWHAFLMIRGCYEETPRV